MVREQVLAVGGLEYAAREGCGVLDMRITILAKRVVVEEDVVCGARLQRDIGQI